MSTTKAPARQRDLTAEITYLTRALEAPTLRESVSRLAERARAESWTHEEFLAACLQREVAARESHGGEGRIPAARLPPRRPGRAPGHVRHRRPVGLPARRGPPRRAAPSRAHPAGPLPAAGHRRSR